MDKKDKPYVRVPIALLEMLMEGEITKPELAVWMAIKSFDWTDQGKGDGCTASQSTIGEVAGIQRQKIGPLIKSLISKGLIEQTVFAKPGEGTNTYICLEPEMRYIHPAYKRKDDSLQNETRCLQMETGYVSKKRQGMSPNGDTVDVSKKRHEEKKVFKNNKKEEEEKKKAILAKLKNKQLPIAVVKQELLQEGIGLEDLSDKEITELFGKYGPMMVRNMVKRSV